MQCKPIKLPLCVCVWFLVKVSVIGNRSSCLSHASLIVPWPALSCQLQPASASENQRKRTKEEQAAARGEGTEANHYTERERGESKMMASAGGRSATIAILSWKVAAKG